MNTNKTQRGGAVAIAKNFILITGLALMALLPSVQAGPSLNPINPAVPGLGTNYFTANTTTYFNMPGWTSNSVGYVSTQSPAPVWNVVASREFSFQGVANETATNTTTETFTFLCSLDNVNWITPPPPLPQSYAIQTLNTNYSQTNFVFGTNCTSGAYPFWGISSITHSGNPGVLTNLNIKIFMKSGGL